MMTETPQEPPKKKYDLLITTHARERWVERIVDPKHYAHLGTGCEGCDACVSLAYDLRNALRICGRNIDISIVSRFRIARDEGNLVTDANFIQAMTKQYGSDMVYLKFYLSGDAVFMVSQRPEEDTPVLLTVMTYEMIEGTVFRKLSGEEMRKVFNRWKHQIRQRM